MKCNSDLDNHIFSSSQKMRMLIRCIIFTFLHVFYAAETEGALRNWYDDHGLKCLASNGKPCHFPFKYKDKVTIWLYKMLDSIQSISVVFILHSR